MYAFKLKPPKQWINYSFSLAEFAFWHNNHTYYYSRRDNYITKKFDVCLLTSKSIEIFEIAYRQKKLQKWT